MHKIAVIPGDGIGPEVIGSGVKVLEAAAQRSHTEISFAYFPFGALHYLKTSETLSEKSLNELLNFSAVYLGAVGDPRIPPGILERGIVGALRWKLDLYVNLRPLKLYADPYCPLKNVIPFDILVVRENTEDLYTGPSGFIQKDTSCETALSIAFYTRNGVERILRYAFLSARNRRKKLTLCDKANAIPAHDLWRRTFAEMQKEYPDVATELIYVDACAMAFIRRPQEFDVLVTTNLFGDILTDLGAELCGGIGVAPSANLHPGKFAVFEPIHGSAPKYAGKNLANPLGAILAGAMLLDYLGEHEGAGLIENAVSKSLTSGKLKSLGSDAGMRTDEITNLVLSFL